MKNRFFKTVLPLVAILIGALGAVAFEQAPERAEKTELQKYIRYGEGVCEPIDFPCSEVVKPQFCTNGSNWIHKMNSTDTDCSDPLYRLN